MVAGLQPMPSSQGVRGPTHCSHRRSLPQALAVRTHWLRPGASAASLLEWDMHESQRCRCGSGRDVARDVMTFKSVGPSAWTTVELDDRRPFLPPYPPSPPPPLPSSPSPPSPSPSLPSVAEDSSLSAGAVAGIAGGGTVLAGLVLAIIVISVHVCRKMNRELKQVKKPASETPETPVPAVQGKTRQADIQLA